MRIEQARAIFSKVNGASFVGLDCETKVTLRGGRANEMQGRVTKLMSGAQVMVFTNTNSNAYKNMVERRLVAEGKNPNFELSPRAWGERIPNTPFIQHTKDDVTKYYLEVIFLKPGTVNYFLDGVQIDKANIVGLNEVEVNPESQAGLDNKVIIRTFALESIVGIRIDGKDYVIIR